MRPVIVDIAEFIANPLRSGIQRVVRKLVANWPSEIPVVFARYDPAAGGLVVLSPRDLRTAVEHKPDARPAQTQRPSGSVPIALTEDDVVLVPEVFYDLQRVAFYGDLLAGRRCRVGFVVFDFIPWLRPSAIELGSAGSALIMPYLMLMLGAKHRCFISAAVRDEFVRRIARDAAGGTGPVFPLGADSFDIERQRFSPDRVDIVCLGTLDGKKGQDVVFDAFEAARLGARGRLVCLGKIPAKPAIWMRKLLTNARDDVSIIDNPSEDAIAAALRRARASAFVSTNEGFGLPAVESLHCGIPVVAHEELPCLAGLPAAGQIRLPHVTAEAVRGALTRLADDDEARKLWSDGEGLRLQTWSGYAASLAGWAVGIAEAEPPREGLATSAAHRSEAGVETWSGTGR